jgi:S-ribosylhomocysteine lyase LuxS involved in autoinducer biosynthesis
MDSRNRVESADFSPGTSDTGFYICLNNKSCKQVLELQ